MASTFTTSFGIEKIGTGEQAGAWGTTTNHNADILDRIASYKAVGLSGTTHTLTVREASPGAGTENLQDGMYRVIKFTGALGANNTVTIAPNTSSAWFIFENATTDSGSSGPYSVILSQGSGANITLQNGKNAIVYCDGAGSGAAVFNALNDLQMATLEVTGAGAVDGAFTVGGTTTVVALTASGLVTAGAKIDMNGTELILDADADTSITADTDDTIDIRIAGADDFQFTANTFTAQSGSTIAAQALTATTVTASDIVTANAKLDLNGTELILDVDADTSITADTDDTIDIRIAGADDFQFTANTFTAVSGSTIATNTIAETTAASGVTIDGLLIKDGGLSDLLLPAVSGIIEANANFIDMCLVGPSVDGKSWNGHFSNGAVWTSLMLATVETSGSDAQVNIWDLTAGTLASATPLATLTLTGATPTSIAASMGYIIVGTSDQGMHIVAPHDTGAWAEKTEGWPRSLTTSGAPVLTNVDVQLVSAGLKQAPVYDPSTNGPIPCFGISYGTGADTQSLIKDDGNVYDRSGTVASAGLPCFISNGYFFSVVASDRVYRSVSPIDAITADDWSYNDAVQTGSATAPGTGMDAALDINHGWIVGADTDHLIVAFEPATSADLSSATQRSPSAEINRTYNTGFMPAQIVLAALANSATADRSNNSNTLTENGTVTEAAVETGAELKGYSGWSSSNYMSRAYDADFDFGVADWSAILWFKIAANGAAECLFNRDDGTFGTSNPYWGLHIEASGELAWFGSGASASWNANTGASGTDYDDGIWHMAACVNEGAASQKLYIDGVLVASATVTIGTVSNGDAVLYVGERPDASRPLTDGTLALLRFSAAAPTATQIRQMYEAEAPMFEANAKVLLQSGSTDAVLDAKVDPLSGKYIVTQTDSQVIFDGLAIETERTIASGGSTFEHGLLWGDAVAEINDANLFASTPATDQRQVNEMVRSLSADMPGGVDLSKAKAYYEDYGKTSANLVAGYNIESIARNGTGDWTITFAIPFKTDDYIAAGISNGDIAFAATTGKVPGSTDIRWYNTSGAAVDARGMVVFFGELENE